MAVRRFNVMDFGKTGLLEPEHMGYKDSLEIIQDESMKLQKSFVKIGWYLKHIRDNELYREDGYTNIYECATDKLGYAQSTTSRFIKICEKFSKDGNSPELDEKYVGFDKSQMIEMLPMESEELDRVSPDMTVKQIRDIKTENKQSGKKADQEADDNIPGQTSLEKDFQEYMPKHGMEDLKEDISDIYATSHKEDNDADPAVEEIIDGEYREIEEQQEEKLSPYGLPKTVYSEGSLLTTVGCGHKHDCFSCSQDCAIRQKDRYCNGAPLGNPFPCTTMHVLEDIRSEIGGQCQFINLDIAEHTAGSNEPNPCCKNCTVLECDYRCRRTLEMQASDKDAAEDELPMVGRLLENTEPKLEEIIQPELPALKNNDQRKEWLADYKSWGLWYRDENIDVNYYKYDFRDGSRLVVAEYPQRHSYHSNQCQDECFYHLLEKNKKGYEKTYDESYRHTPDSMTYLIDFLKNL